MVVSRLFAPTRRNGSTSPDATGSYLVAFLLFQLLVLRAPLPIKATIAVGCVTLSLRHVAARTVMLATIPVVIWGGFVALVGIATGTGPGKAVPLTLTLYTMILAAVVLYHHVGTTRIRTFVRAMGSRVSLPGAAVVSDIAGAFFDLLPEIESIILGTFLAARIRGGRRPIRTYVVAIRRSLILLAGLPARKATILALRRIGDVPDDNRHFARFLFPVLVGVMIVIQEIAVLLVSR